MGRLIYASLLTAVLAMIGTSGVSASVRVEDEETVFRLDDVSVTSVYLIGDFNAWNPTMDRLDRVDGGFEIRLFLLPGRYRYRFIIDGVSKPDPDNPFVDAAGNSCFILIERDGVLRILLSEAAETGGASVTMAAAVSGRARAFVTEDGVTLFGDGRIRGDGGERAHADIGLGATVEYLEGGAERGASVLLRGSATYRLERGTLTAFTRSGRVGLGDPLPLFTTVGPFRYPLGLFCRGFSFEGELPLRLDFSTFYASRIRGYQSGLGASASDGVLFASEDLTDSDLIGGTLGTTVGHFTGRYLLRLDRRPKSGVWPLPGVADERFRGFVRGRFQGFSVSAAGDAGIALEGELVFGETRLAALEQLQNGDSLFRPVSLERRWEHGRRLRIGVVKTSGTGSARLVLSQTTIEGEPSMRDGRPGGERTALEATLAGRMGRCALDLRGAVEAFSASNTGSVFWLDRTNFWLDGDELTCDRIPFLSARQIAEWSLRAVGEGDTLAGLPHGTGLSVSIAERRELGGRALWREVGLSKGLRLMSRGVFFVDMRGVSYRYGEGERDFVDAFVSLRAAIAPSLWCSLGCGVNPFGFDRWLFDFSDHGRADYLIDRGVFRVLGERGESSAVKALVDAEEELAGDFMITFEGGYAF
jgi:hypothetical protein